MLLAFLFLLASFAAHAQPAPVKIQIAPERPLIERRGPLQFLNFDFLLHNTGATPLRIARIELSVYDQANQLVLRRLLDENGHPSGIATLPTRELPAGAAISVFNPFYFFDDEVKLHRLRYQFFFAAPDSRLNSLLDYESMAEVSVSPQEYPGKTNLALPVRARSIIFDGHDFYAHHRRQDLTSEGFKKLGVTKNTVRYGYDFCPVNAKGEMYKDSPYKAENWYGYGVPLYAPGAGTVAAASDGLPDNEYHDKAVKYAEGANLEQSIFGNYVVIDHGNGERSHLVHMKNGSVKVKKGDRVQQGDVIGAIGFSGDAFIPHLHYMLTDGTALNSEGLPSYFRNFRRVLGAESKKVTKGQIDSGDIVEAAK